MYACPRIPPIAKALLVELRVYYSHDLREISKLSRHVILLSKGYECEHYAVPMGHDRVSR